MGASVAAAGASVSVTAASVGALVFALALHCAMHSAVGAEPRMSLMGSHSEANLSSAVDTGFFTPYPARVSQTLSPTTSRSPSPYFALQTTASPSHVHCASWKHLHEHMSSGAAVQSVSDTFVVT